MKLDEYEKGLISVALGYLEDTIEGMIIPPYGPPASIHPYLKTKDGLKEVIDLRKKMYRKRNIES